MTECLIDITCQQTQKGMKVERWVGGTCTVCQFWLKVSAFPTHPHPTETFRVEVLDWRSC